MTASPRYILRLAVAITVVFVGVVLVTSVVQQRQRLAGDLRSPEPESPSPFAANLIQSDPRCKVYGLSWERTFLPVNFPAVRVRLVGDCEPVALAVNVEGLDPELEQIVNSTITDGVVRLTRTAVGFDLTNEGGDIGNETSIAIGSPAQYFEIRIDADNDSNVDGYCCEEEGLACYPNVDADAMSNSNVTARDECPGKWFPIKPAVGQTTRLNDCNGYCDFSQCCVPGTLGGVGSCTVVDVATCEAAGGYMMRNSTMCAARAANNCAPFEPKVYCNPTAVSNAGPDDDIQKEFGACVAVQPREDGTYPSPASPFYDITGNAPTVSACGQKCGFYYCVYQGNATVGFGRRCANTRLALEDAVDASCVLNPAQTQFGYLETVGVETYLHPAYCKQVDASSIQAITPRVGALDPNQLMQLLWGTIGAHGPGYVESEGYYIPYEDGAFNTLAECQETCTLEGGWQVTTSRGVTIVTPPTAPAAPQRPRAAAPAPSPVATSTADLLHSGVLQ